MKLTLSSSFRKLKIHLLSFLFLFIPFLTQCKEFSPSHYVIVSVAPHKFLVEQIAGEFLQVGLLVPAGASAHTFEPSPKQMIQASHADIWFRMGEGFENRALAALKSYQPNLKVIDLRQNLDLISCEPGHSCCHHHESFYDLHFWLSPKQAEQQAKTIAQALCETYPSQANEFQAHLQNLLKDLKKVNLEIEALLQDIPSRTIMVSHPAYAYFCRDYKLSQLSIEFEGKDPTPHQLTKILNAAREKNIKKVFTQIQYSNKGARLIASEIGAEVIQLDPYAENILHSLQEIAKAIAS